MGLLLDLLAFPIVGPLKGITWIAEKFIEQGENELYDEGAVRGKLMELELANDMGEITEEEYAQAEEILLGRLKIIKERRAAQNES